MIMRGQLPGEAIAERRTYVGPRWVHWASKGIVGQV